MKETRPNMTPAIIVWAIIWLCCCCVFKCAQPMGVFIVAPDGKYPFYVQSGTNLSLLCTAGDRMLLQWQYQRRPIRPAMGSRPLLTRYTVEEPTGRVEYQLIRLRARLIDTGRYTCQNNITTNVMRHTELVQVLYITAVNVTAPHGSKSIKLRCKITGFYTNAPPIVNHWYANNTRLYLDDKKYSINSSDDGLETELIVGDLAKMDGGLYRCSFVIQVENPDGENVTLSQDLHLNADQLGSSSSSRLLASPSSILVGLCLFLLLIKSSPVLPAARVAHTLLL